jgi:hypothetical protein
MTGCRNRFPKVGSILVDHETVAHREVRALRKLATGVGESGEHQTIAGKSSGRNIITRSAPMSKPIPGPPASRSRRRSAISAARDFR